MIGPRSAAFAPVARSRASSSWTRSTTRRTSSASRRATTRARPRRCGRRQNGAALVFGSATPSMEALQRGAPRAARASAAARAHRRRARCPRVEIVDLRRETARPDEKGVPLFSRRARRAPARGLRARRAGDPAAAAPGLRAVSPVPRLRPRLPLHASAASRGRSTTAAGRCSATTAASGSPRPARCPDCGGGVLEAIGAGTERVAERFAELFPGVSHARARPRHGAAARRRGGGRRTRCSAATDRLPHRNADGGQGARLSGRDRGRRPLGRHAAALPGLSLRGEDVSAARAGGRARRAAATGPGTVHVQTFHPAHPAIRRAAEHDVAGFAAAELEFRRTFFYPPFSELAAILVSRRSSARPRRRRPPRSATRCAAGEGAALSGPAPAPLERLQGRWRFQILLRAADRRAVLARPRGGDPGARRRRACRSRSTSTRRTSSDGRPGGQPRYNRTREHRRRQLRGTDPPAAPADRGALGAPGRRRAPARDREAAREAGAGLPGDLREPDALAEDARRAPPRAPVSARLRRGSDVGLRRAPRRPEVRRRRRGRRRLRTLPREAGGGRRSPEGAGHEGEDPPQLRHAAPRGLPQGAARDGARREVRAPDPLLRRHRRRLSRASTPRSAARPRRSRSTCGRWRASTFRSS